MKITFIGHSGFLCQNGKAAMLFDYFEGDIPEMEQEKIYIFSSHMHPDHFNAELFKKFRNDTRVTFVFSDDIKMSEKFMKRYDVAAEDIGKIIYTGVHDCFTDGYINVSTLESNDRGCAFLVKAEGETFLHLGDLNVWAFEGDDAKDVEKSRLKFEKEISSIGDVTINYAFIPVDPRLDRKHMFDALDYCMDNLKTENVFPMHMFGNFSCFPALVEHAAEKSRAEKIRMTDKEGTVFDF